MQPGTEAALLESLIAIEIANMVRIYGRTSTKPIFDTSDMPALRDRFGSRLITGSAFHADIQSLPFRTRTFAATIGVHLLEQLDGKEIAAVLAECARVADISIWVLKSDLLRGNLMRSTQQCDGSYVTEIGADWLLRCSQSWPGTWNLRGDRFRMCPGGIVCAWREDEQGTACSA